MILAHQAGELEHVIFFLLRSNVLGRELGGGLSRNLNMLLTSAHINHQVYHHSWTNALAKKWTMVYYPWDAEEDCVQKLGPPQPAEKAVQKSS